MSPHAMVLDPDEISSQASFSRPPSLVNGNGNGHGGQLTEPSLLRSYPHEEIHDLVCVGFGPASLAIAVALNDALESNDPAVSNRQPKVHFLERQPRFAWHAGMLLARAKMQITFIKDLATLRNPRSRFTFLNYLHQNDRLVSFTNLGTFLPQRIEYEDYMRWCANQFDDVVDYSQDVESVEIGQKNPQTGAVEHFVVKSRDQASGRVATRRAKHVVIAAGGKPNIPKNLQVKHPRVIHSSQYATSVHKIFPPGTQPKSVAVIGGGQSAAEIFHNIPTRFPDSKSYLLIRGSALRPSDDSPFVNEVFDPDRVDSIYAQTASTRATTIKADKATNYGVVRLELLEALYEDMYSYRIQHASEADWPQRILNHRTVSAITELPPTTKGNNTDSHALRLSIDNNSATYKPRLGSHAAAAETLDVDLVIIASGYKRDAHEDMLRDLRPLMPEQGPGGDDADARRWQVNRDYGVKFASGSVAADAGVWLQGCNEGTHGLSDTLLSILAIRGGEVVQSIFGGEANAAKGGRGVSGVEDGLAH